MKVKRALAAAALAVSALAVSAGPAAAGEWTCENPAGNTVHGECNGEALVVVNPGGNVPPGQNK
jgi:hypothetical protein